MRRDTLDNLPPLPALPEGYRLRRCIPEDVSALAETFRTSFPEFQWSEARVRAELVEARDVKVTYVVEHEGRAIATASARDTSLFPDSGYLHWVACHPDHRGKHLGSVVTIATLHYFREQSLPNSVLQTDDARLPAIRAYLKLGYRPDVSLPGHAERWKAIGAALGSLKIE